MAGETAETEGEGEGEADQPGAAIGALSAVAELVSAAAGVLQPWTDELTGKKHRAPLAARQAAVEILKHCERFVGRSIGGPS